MSFQQGLSGIDAAAKSLEVIGNNVSNANTVGFKQSRAIFSDVLANSLNGSTTSQIGIGTKIAEVQQQFTQGNITSTNNGLDIAINGSGFFRMSDNGAITYTRNGQFQLDKQGYIVNAENKRLTGYTATNGNLATGAAVELNIDTSDLKPTATSAVTGAMNLDSRATALTSSAFDPTDPTTYNHSTSINVFDTLGNSHSLQSFFVKTAASTWDLYTTVDNVPTSYTPPAVPVPTAQITFTGTGTSPTITPATPNINVAVTTGASNLDINLDYSKMTQFGSSFAVSSISQDGFAAGRMSSFDVGQDGIITGRYTNGQSTTLGQLVLTNFTNPNGLSSLGGNAWMESSTSGAPLIGTPTTGSMGSLQASAIEDSNVDLTAELVNMITAQRVYQANAQTIKTEDQIMQTLVSLK